jgi:hypothetical protein
MGHALAEKEHEVAPSVDRYDYCNQVLLLFPLPENHILLGNADWKSVYSIETGRWFLFFIYYLA